MANVSIFKCNSPVDDYRKAFKNDFSLRPPAYALIFWIYMRDGVHEGKIFVSKLNFAWKFDFGAYSYRYPPKLCETVALPLKSRWSIGIDIAWKNGLKNAFSGFCFLGDKMNCSIYTLGHATLEYWSICRGLQKKFTNGPYQPDYWCYISVIHGSVVIA